MRSQPTCRQCLVRLSNRLHLMADLRAIWCRATLELVLWGVPIFVKGATTRLSVAEECWDRTAGFALCVGG